MKDLMISEVDAIIEERMQDEKYVREALDSCSLFRTSIIFDVLRTRLDSRYDDLNKAFVAQLCCDNELVLGYLASVFLEFIASNPTDSVATIIKHEIIKQYEKLK